MTVAPPADPTEIAKGGLWAGSFKSFDVDPNAGALLLDIRWTTTDDGRTTGDAYLGGNTTVSAQQIGSDDLLTIMHELGYTLGLKHGHESELHDRTAPTRSCPASGRTRRNCRSASRACRTPPVTGTSRTS